MGEYDRRQQKQESRAIAYNGGGNRQLKVIVDNRRSLLGIPHSSPIQLTKWKWNSIKNEWSFFSCDDGIHSSMPTFHPAPQYNGRIFDSTTGGGWEGESEPVVEAVEEDEDVVEYFTSELKSFMEKDTDIQGTIGNIIGGAKGTSQTYTIDGKKVFHKHVEGDNAIAFRWNGEKLVIMGWGIKSDSAPKGTGGYQWDKKPK